MSPHASRPGRMPSWANPSASANRRPRAGLAAAPAGCDPCDLVHGAFRFATADRRVWVGGKQVLLAPKEFDLAVLLFRSMGSLVSRQTMVDQIWRYHVDPSSRTVVSHLSRIRTKLSLWPHNGVRLSAVYGLGSRLDPA